MTLPNFKLNIQLQPNTSGPSGLSVDFSASSTSVNFWQSVTFTDSTPGAPTSWLWDFGDGTFSTVQNPVKIYDTPGTYSVTLKASDDSGAGGSVTKAAYITIGGDSSAAALMAANKITNATMRQATNTLIAALKSAGIWDKSYAIYITIYGSEFANKFNAKNPVDSDAAYRLKFFLGFTHSSTGMLVDETKALCSTNIYPSTLPNWITDNHMVAYNRNAALGSSAFAGVLMGIGNTSTGTPRFSLSALRSTGVPFYESGLSARVSGPTQTDARGFWGGVCRASNNRSLYKNGVSIATSSNTNTEAAPAYPIYLGGLVDLAGGSSVTQLQQERLPAEFGYVGIGKALSDSEMAAYYTAVQAFMTTLGLQV